MGEMKQDADASMNLNKAKVCVNCDVVFEGDQCPMCGGSDGWQWLSKWLKPLMPGRSEAINIHAVESI